MEKLMIVLLNPNFLSSVIVAIAALTFLQLIKLLAGNSQAHRFDTTEHEIILQLIREENEKKCQF